MATSKSDVIIDAGLYCAIAAFAASQAYLGGDEAAKYVEPAFKFWINYGLVVGAAITGALKMFRSGTFTAFKQNGQSESEPKP